MTTTDTVTRRTLAELKARYPGQQWRVLHYAVEGDQRAVYIPDHIRIHALERLYGQGRSERACSYTYTCEEPRQRRVVIWKDGGIAYTGRLEYTDGEYRLVNLWPVKDARHPDTVRYMRLEKTFATPEAFCDWYVELKFGLFLSDKPVTPPVERQPVEHPVYDGALERV